MTSNYITTICSLEKPKCYFVDLSKECCSCYDNSPYEKLCNHAYL